MRDLFYSVVFHSDVKGQVESERAKIEKKRDSSSKCLIRPGGYYVHWTDGGIIVAKRPPAFFQKGMHGGWVQRQVDLWCWW